MTAIAQRRNAILDSNLLYGTFGTLAFGIGITSVSYFFAWPLSWADSWFVYAVLAAGLLLKAGLYYAVRLNKQWAKWSLLGFYLLTSAVQVATCLTYSTARQKALNPTELIPTIIINGMTIGALVLLFRKPATQKA